MRIGEIGDLVVAAGMERTTDTIGHAAVIAKANESWLKVLKSAPHSARAMPMSLSARVCIDKRQPLLVRNRLAPAQRRRWPEWRANAFEFIAASPV